MKLGVSYIVFDGAELLEHSIRQIRSHVDYVNVVYQTQSWFGRLLSKEDFQILQNLKKTGKIDELINFSAFTPLKSKDKVAIARAKGFERTKRQVGLSACLKKGCTHYLGMDVDEFYVTEEFIKAKESIIKNGFDSTAVRYINYVNTPTLHRGIDSNRVPFICRVSAVSQMGHNFFVKCDPTRGVKGVSAKKHEFPTALIKMHHMETVRKDLLIKYESTTRAIFNRNKTNELVHNIKSINTESKSFSFNKIIFPGLSAVALTKCDNLFGIPYESWKK